MSTNFGNSRVDTVSREEMMPAVVDTVLRGNRFFKRTLAKTKKFNAATKQVPVKWQTSYAIAFGSANSAAGSSFLGGDTLSTGRADTRVLMNFNPKFYGKNVTLDLTDVLANGPTENKMIDLVQIEMESAAQDMADDIGRIFYADGTGNSSKDFNGLAILVASSGSIGGLSRSTYATLQSSVIQVGAGSGGTPNSPLALSSMRALKNSISDDGIEPDVVVASFDLFGSYEALLQPQERIVKTSDTSNKFKGYTGFDYDTLAYGGMPFIPDRKATANTLFMLNEDYIDFFALDNTSDSMKKLFDGVESIDLSTKNFLGSTYKGETKNLGFFWAPFVRPVGQLTSTGFIVMAGDLLTINPRRHGKLTFVA